MNFYFIFYLVLIFSVILISFWIYSEKKLNGKFSKSINYFSFPLAILGLYCVFRLNLDFGYILVGLTLISLFLWFLGRILYLEKLIKESRSFFLILSVITVFRSFIFEPFQIPSESMIPGLEVGDFVLVNKFEYGLKNPIGNKTLILNNTPERGDVIVFTPPHTSCSSKIEDAYPEGSLSPTLPDQFIRWNSLNNNCSTFGLKYVKRVIAVPGDTLELKGKEFFINGKKIKKKLIESNLNQSIYKETQNLKEYFVGNSNLRELKFYQSWVIPKGYFFVVGDNRDNSLDSRSWGLVPEKNVTGKAQLIWLHWPSYGSIPSLSRNKIIK